MPVEVVEVHTDDVDLARQMLDETFLERPATYLGTPGSCEVRLRVAQAGDLHGSRVRSTMPVRVQVTPFPEFTASTVLSGGLDWTVADREHALSPGDVTYLPSDTGSSCSYRDIELATVRIPMAAVARAAEAYAGIAPGELRFTDVVPVSSASAARWRALSEFVHQSLDGTGPVHDSPLLRAALIDTVATTALTVFANTTMTTAYVRDPGPASAASLRRAVEYIDAHAATPISVADIAEAAGVTPRALQAAFRRRYDITPSGYLRQIRLEGARLDLLAADPTNGVTVDSVAAQWGFARATRFAADYRRHFGEEPGVTLHD